MSFNDYLAKAEKPVVESAQLKLDLMTQITKKVSDADISVLRRVLKLLETKEEIKGE